MEQSYDDLVGGAGRAVYFRSERFRPLALARRFPAQLQVGGAPVRLFDLSMSGLAYLVPDPGGIPVRGTTLPVLISISDVTAFSGQAQVVRTEQEGQRTKVAVRLVDGLLEPAKLRSLHDRLAFEDDIARGIDVFSVVPDAYKRVCADAVLFLNHWRSLLDDRERQVRTSTEPDAGDSLAETEYSAEKRMRSEWMAIRERANQAVLEAFDSAASLHATKRYTEIVVTPLMLSAPIWQRAYTKPLGYPGDYCLMNFMYDPSRRGESAFARILHQLGKEERLSATVPTRKELLIRHIGEAVARGRSNPERPVLITSVGAGPAREVEEYLNRSSVTSRLVFSLIDQDEKALSHANERVRRAAVRYGNLVTVNCRYASFKQMMARSELLDEMKDQDLIYSAGLFDYLTEPVARTLMNRFFQLSGPGGSVLLGNAAEDPDVKWVPEFVLDWHMTYRTERQMRDLASDIGDAAKIKIERDPSGAWFFLVVGRL